MPAERHLALGSVSDDPDMRDFRMTSHVARYPGVSFGAVAGRPARPSITATGRGGVPGPRGATGAAFGSNTKYTPVKSGCDGVCCARIDAVNPARRHTSDTESKAKVFDMMSSPQPRLLSARRHL